MPTEDDVWAYVQTTPYSNRHEILTGSQLDGRAYPPDADYTCDNWTSNRDPEGGARGGPGMGMGMPLGPDRPNAQIGFPDRNGGGDGSWNSSYGTRGCSQTSLTMTQGTGKLYCFAID